MEAENVLNLLDSYWYDLNIFGRSKPIKDNKIPEIPFSNNSDSTIPTLPIIHTKMYPDSKMSDFSASPNSVLQSPKLQTIFSGKETKEFDGELNSEKSGQQPGFSTPKVNSCSGSLKGNLVNSCKRKKKRLSKSLSDLEFEELKGFMDLGFVFSEEDKDSILAHIIPGLQRLGYNNNSNSNDNNNNNNNNNNKTVYKNNDKNAVSRPYLSEAWEVIEKKKRENPSIMKWKVPVSTNQIDMKGYLKSWAHNVASAVK